MNIVLEVPGEIPKSQLIRAYFAHRITKTRDENRRESTRAAGEELAETVSESFVITEDIPSAVIETYGGDPIIQLFESKSGEFESIHGDQITELIRILREAGRVTRTESIGPESWDPLCSMERRVIALCEFALENGYELSLSF